MIKRWAMKISKNKNKAIAVGAIIFVLLLILGALFVINRPKEETKETENDAESNLVEENTEKTKETDGKSDGETEDNEVEENKPEEKREDEKTGKSANQSNNKDNKNSKSAPSTNSNSTVTPKPTYSCPNGYQLNGTKCVETINAKYGCPSGMHESVNNMCIKFDEGYEVNKEHKCPSGETMIHMTGFMGTADKYECYPLHKKEYSCPSDYILGGEKCTKTINATNK